MAACPAHRETRNRLLADPPTLYGTFSVPDLPPPVPQLFSDDDAATYLIIFILFGFLGVHRMYRIAKEPGDRLPRSDVFARRRVLLAVLDLVIGDRLF